MAMVVDGITATIFEAVSIYMMSSAMCKFVVRDVEWRARGKMMGKGTWAIWRVRPGGRREVSSEGRMTAGGETNTELHPPVGSGRWTLPRVLFRSFSVHFPFNLSSAYSLYCGCAPKICLPTYIPLLTYILLNFGIKFLFGGVFGE